MTTGNWDEHKHPRASDGRFGTVAGSHAGKVDAGKPRQESSPDERRQKMLETLARARQVLAQRRAAGTIVKGVDDLPPEEKRQKMLETLERARRVLAERRAQQKQQQVAQQKAQEAQDNLMKTAKQSKAVGQILRKGQTPEQRQKMLDTLARARKVLAERRSAQTAQSKPSEIPSKATAVAKPAEQPTAKPQVKPSPAPATTAPAQKPARVQAPKVEKPVAPQKASAAPSASQTAQQAEAGEITADNIGQRLSQFMKNNASEIEARVLSQDKNPWKEIEREGEVVQLFCTSNDKGKLKYDSQKTRINDFMFNRFNAIMGVEKIEPGKCKVFGTKSYRKWLDEEGMEYHDKMCQTAYGAVRGAFNGNLPPPRFITAGERDRMGCADFGEISVAINSDCSRTIHELGHHIEHQNPRVLSACNAFLAYRAKGEKPTDIGGAMKGEFGIKDNFKHHYCGKTYGKGETEILSMGLEEICKRPHEFLKEDPEYFHFIMGIMSGKI